MVTLKQHFTNNKGRYATGVAAVGTGILYFASLWPFGSDHKINVRDLAGRDLYVLAGTVGSRRYGDTGTEAHIPGKDKVSLYVATEDNLEEVKNRLGEADLSDRNATRKLVEDLRKEGLVERIVATDIDSQRRCLRMVQNLEGNPYFQTVEINPDVLDNVNFEWMRNGKSPVGIGTGDVLKDDHGLKEIVISDEKGLLLVRTDYALTGNVRNELKLIPETDQEAIGESVSSKMFREGDSALQGLRGYLDSARQRIQANTDGFEAAANAELNDAQGFVRVRTWNFATEALEAYEANVTQDARDATDAALKRAKKDAETARQVWGSGR